MRTPKVLSLDNVEDVELEVFCPSSGRNTPPKTIERLLQMMLRRAIDDKALAVNFFNDYEDDAFRALQYLAGGAAQELLPAPGYVGPMVIEKIRTLAGVGRPQPGSGVLAYEYENVLREATVTCPDLDEVRLYFSEARPPMKRKGRKLGG